MLADDAVLPGNPAWPQLPKRTCLENMYVQFSEGLPGDIIANGCTYVNLNQTDAGLEALYTAYLADDINAGAISSAYAAGLARFPKMKVELADRGLWTSGRGLASKFKRATEDGSSCHDYARTACDRS